MFKAIPFLLAAAVPFAGVKALDLLDDCQAPSGKWSFSVGGEFPGATGSLTAGMGGLVMAYDFTKGGNYVAAIRALPASTGPLELGVTLQAPSACGYHLRVVDATGRTFQSVGMMLQGGVETVATITPGMKWAGSWNAKEAKTPQLPWQNFSIGIEHQVGTLTFDTGQLIIKKVAYHGVFDRLARFTGQPFSVAALGWKLNGRWGGALDAPMLLLTAAGGGTDAILTCTRPTGDKPLFANYALKGGAGETAFDLSQFAPMTPAGETVMGNQAVFDPNLPDGGNDYNRYTVTLELKTADGCFRFSSRLNGAKSGAVAFGEPKSSDQIKHLPIGTNAHFQYASGHDCKMGKGYKKLIDLIAAAGFKYLRDTPGLEKGADGKLHVRPYDREWLTYAKAKGLEPILVMLEINDPMADMDDVLARNLIYARELKGIARIYEIGNEINWSRKYPNGTWNGMVSATDTSTAQGLREITKTTNRIADAIARERPDAILIGLGEGTALNFRMLELGVSRNLHGVVDHAYTYSLPPEKDIWANNFKRDGILVGDQAGSFFGLVDSYLAEFKKTGGPRQLWITEFGFSTFSFSGQNEGALYAPFSEDAQAAYLVRRLLMTLYRQDAISATIQYDIMEAGQNPADPECYFGLLHNDFSPKPAYFAVQRLNSLMAEARPDAAKVVVTANPLHRSAERNDGMKWDAALIKADNGVLALPFSNPETPHEKMVALWSAQPFSGEFAPRSVSFSVSGWPAYGYPLAVGIDILTGDTFDVPVKMENGVLTVSQMTIGQHPCLLKFFTPPQRP